MDSTEVRGPGCVSIKLYLLAEVVAGHSAPHSPITAGGRLRPSEGVLVHPGGGSEIPPTGWLINSTQLSLTCWGAHGQSRPLVHSWRLRMVERRGSPIRGGTTLVT